MLLRQSTIISFQTSSNNKNIVGTYSRTNGTYDKGNASLDRIDSDKGYTEGNVVWVYKPINLMKNTFSSEEFINICKLIVEHNK